MSPDWGTLPLLPLRCILDHLSLEDAMAAMSTCKHWRSAMLLYEGHREILNLDADYIEKCMHLTRLFKKHVKKLNIYLDCDEEDLENFMNYVLPQFFDTVKLQELIFVGPNFIQQGQHITVKLKRIVTESLIHKHLHSLQKLALLGCEMGVAVSDQERFTHKNTEYYSRPLSFNCMPSPADTVLSSCNTGVIMYSMLQHIIVDYENIYTEGLETLSELATFSRLTLNVGYKRHTNFHPIDWERVEACYPNGLEVTVNIIGLPVKKFDEVIENVLREGMPLIAIKVMFCKTVYQPLLQHVVRAFKQSVREVVWADAPSPADPPRATRHPPLTQYGLCNVNPFILLCWQCTQLRRLVIHGYWVWQYDLLGFVRLRKSLCALEVPALYRRQERFSARAAARVRALDHPPPLDRDFVQEMNEFTEFKWKPTPWSRVHPGLRARATAEQRAEYVTQEALRPGVT